MLLYFNLYWNAVIQSTPVAGEYFGLHMKTQYTTVCGLKEETRFTLLRSLVNSRLRVVQQLQEKEEKNEYIYVDNVVIYIDHSDGNWNSYICRSEEVDKFWYTSIYVQY